MAIGFQPSIYQHTFANQATVCFAETPWGGITPLPAQQKVSGNPSSRFLSSFNCINKMRKKSEKNVKQT